jgi:putative ABC transport system substrate-binding protein
VVKRREFVSLLVGAAGIWPVALRAQQRSPPRVGLLCGTKFDDQELEAVRQGLREAGYTEGKNVSIEYRSAEGQYDRLPALAAELVDLRLPLIVAIGGTATAVAAKGATKTVPIVFAVGGDPVKVGLVSSMNRPEGNVTGLAFLVTGLGAKRLELLREMVPTVGKFGYLANPANPNTNAESGDVEAAARALGRPVLVVSAANDKEIEAAFAQFEQAGVNALIVASDAFFNSRRKQFVTLAAMHRLPAIHDLREFVVAGALMSYGTDRNDSYRLAGVYAGRVLNGEKPSDLPVVQSTKLQLVLNLKTAKALGVEIPAKLLAVADEVIE